MDVEIANQSTKILCISFRYWSHYRELHQLERDIENFIKKEDHKNVIQEDAKQSTTGKQRGKFNRMTSNTS